ncbi:MAG TPA: FtsX-like permease family protein [Rhodanobacter sp.]|jgi:putative ABC transport system permease protein|nr:FtsX-like permease family protein [Rhodanobacter sp.]
MSIRILFSTLRRHSLMPSLVLLQVALACAILCNVLFLAWQQLQPILAPSGVDEKALILVDQLNLPGRAWTAAEVEAGAQALREVTGVRAVSAGLGLPMVSSYLCVMALQGPTGVKVGVSCYEGAGLVKTLGIQLAAGRDFLPSDYPDADDKAAQGNAVAKPVIITVALAHKLFGDADPVGQLLADPGDKTAGGYQVVGVARHLLRNQLSLANDGRADDTVLIAHRVHSTPALSYAVRVDPVMRDIALAGVSKAIKRQFGAFLQVGFPPRVDLYSTLRDAALKTRRAALWLLVGMTLTVVIVTLIGIMGLTGFWVQKRTRQIGIRRALGARRADILREFMAENALIVSMGVVIGMALAYMGNALLIKEYELPRLPWSWLPIGALLMLALGQLAVLSPARRAASVPPVVATRSV